MTSGMTERNLRRSEKNRVFLGVCGGLAEYFDVDPVIVRILFLILFAIDPRFIIVYFVLALIMPRGEEVEKGAVTNDEKSRRVLGYGLIAIGLLILFHEFFALLNTGLVLGVILVVIGILVILGGGRSEEPRM